MWNRQFGNGLRSGAGRPAVGRVPRGRSLGIAGCGSWGISLLASVACNSSVTAGGGQCVAGMQTCVDNTLFTCGSGGYVPAQACDASRVCDDKLGCVACRPSLPTCVGDEVHACSESGTVGALTEACAFGQRCRDGACIDACEVAASDFVYLVDDQNNFLSFSPKNDVGAGRWPASLPSLARWLARRPAGAIWLCWGESVFDGRRSQGQCLGAVHQRRAREGQSQGCLVRRNQLSAVAAGLGYLRHGLCQRCPGQQDRDALRRPGQRRREHRHGTGQAGRQPGAVARRHLHGHHAQPRDVGHRRRRALWLLPSNQAGKHLIALINRSDASFIRTYSLAPLPSVDQNYAFAFAHWGGRFYYFIDMKLNTGERVSRVYRYDPGPTPAPWSSTARPTASSAPVSRPAPRPSSAKPVLTYSSPKALNLTGLPAVPPGRVGRHSLSVPKQPR